MKLVCQQPYNRRSRRAFTVVELVGIIAVIAILTGLLVPALAKTRDADLTHAAASYPKDSCTQNMRCPTKLSIV